MYMLPNGKAISLKLPYGYNVPFVIGGLTEKLIFGDLGWVLNTNQQLFDFFSYKK